MFDVSKHTTRWVIRKYENDQAFRAGKPFEVSMFEGNVLLNEGITRLQNLLTGGGGANYGNAAAYLGVGDASTAEDPAQTGLLAPVNKLWKAMETSYPSIAGQATTWRSVFGSAEANFDWNEFTVVNAATDTGDNLNRKVSAQGTKAAGQTWTLDLTVTWS